MPAGTAKGNRIENYETGISAQDMKTYVLEDNYITKCGTGMRLSNGDYVDVTNNEIRDCGEGIFGGLGFSLDIRRNRVLGSSQAGIRGALIFSVVVEQNVVGRSGGSGIFLEELMSPIVRENTLYNNRGSGIEVYRHLEGAVLVENNIVFGNEGWGLKVLAEVVVELGCNDWFGNGLGAVSSAAVDPTDLNLDPLFCNVDSADVRLTPASPLVDIPKCGTIGASGVGCSMTAALLQMLIVEPRPGAAMVRWRFGSINPTRCWVERAADEAGPWHQVLEEPRVEEGEYVQLDEHPHSGLTWYRIGWIEAGDVGHSAPVSFTLQQSSSLSGVFPNPSRGPVSIEWTLGNAADVVVCSPILGPA
jgi:parallel beta-helix repeat protein